MLIEQAEATMPHHPREECPEVLPWIQNLERLRIVPDYSMKVKRVIEGTRGCAHLSRALSLPWGSPRSRDIGPPMREGGWVFVRRS